MSIKANRPPIRPPYNLSKLDLIRRINNKNKVALREVIFMKTNGANGFSNICFDYIEHSKKQFLKTLKFAKKKTQKRVS